MHTQQIRKLAAALLMLSSLVTAAGAVAQIGVTRNVLLQEELDVPGYQTLLETFSAKTMIAGALLGTLGALTYWRLVYRRQVRFGSPLLSDHA